MKTTPARARPILVYDGDCRLCTRASRLADRRWLVGDADRRPADDFVGDDAARLHDAGVHNELAVLDPTSGEIRSGYDGILWLLRGGRLRWLVPLLAHGPLAWLGRLDYRTIAYNRRILSPVDRTAACACDPDFHRGYRWTFVALCLVWLAVVGAAAGRLLLDAPMPGLVAQPLAWLGVAAALALGLRDARRRLDAVGHVAFMAAAMSLPLLLLTIVRALVLIGWGRGWWPSLLDHARDGAWTFAVVAWLLALPIAACSAWRRRHALALGRGALAAVTAALWLVPAAVVLLLARPAGG